jgi:predicted secreted Zn-dependent protease
VGSHQGDPEARLGHRRPGTRATEGRVALTPFATTRAIALALAVLPLAACAYDELRPGEATGRAPAQAGMVTEEYATPAPAEARVIVRTQLRPYDIAGSSAPELRVAMDRLGPKDPVDGTPYAGFTRWRIEWSYDYAGATPCTLTRVRVVATIQIAVPRWRGAGSADPRLAAEWARFVAALRHHEYGHAEIAKRGARRIARLLGSLPSFLSCARLERAADSTGARTLEMTRRAELAYDEWTRHGDTHGVRFSA